MDHRVLPIQTMKGKAGTSFDINRPWVADHRVLKKLEGSFFHAIANMKAYKQCHTFQTFIRGCYDDQRRAFTFGPNGDIPLYFGLQDVYAISKIPVDGKPVICNDILAEEICTNMLGSYKLYKKKKMQVSKVWLRDEFEKVPENPTEDVLIYHVRAYLLYLIGTKILPNSDNSSFFPVFWLQFLQDVDPKALNSVAWGAAAHCLLTSTISSTSTGFLGPSWLYEMFFLERIPKIREAFLVEISDESEKDIPLHTYYSRHMVQPGNRTNNKLNLLSELQAIRFNMTDEDIAWTPYEEYKAYRHQRIFFSRVVLINFNQLQYHEPERGPKQLSIINLEEVGEQEQLKITSSRGTTQRSYCKRYEKYIKMWEERHSETLCIRDTSPAFTLPLEPDQKYPIVYEEDADKALSAFSDSAGETFYGSKQTETWRDDEPMSASIKMKAKRPSSQANSPTIATPINDETTDIVTSINDGTTEWANRFNDKTDETTQKNDDEGIQNPKKKKKRQDPNTNNELEAIQFNLTNETTPKKDDEAHQEASSLEGKLSNDEDYEMNIEQEDPKDENHDCNAVMFQHLLYLIKLLLPFLTQIRKEQEDEIAMEEGMSTPGISTLEYDGSERLYCNRCSTSIFDLHRHCSICKSDICLTCCQEVRKSKKLIKSSSTGCPDLKANKNGHVLCLGKGKHKHNSLLNLWRILSETRISDLEAKAEHILNTFSLPEEIVVAMSRDIQKIGRWLGGAPPGGA